MPREPLPNLYRETKRGKPAWYFRVGKGPRTRIRGAYSSAEFKAAYDAAAAGNGKPERTRGPVEGSVSWALALYRKSQAWAALSLATRRQRDNIFKHVESAYGATAVKAISRADIVASRDKRADRPAAARHFVDAMRGMFEWLVDAEMLRVDPTAGVKVAKVETEGFAPWTADDVAAFRNRWPLGTRERVAFEVLRQTGLRRGDAVCVGCPHLKDGVIRIQTEKTGTWVAIAASDTLLAAIAAGPCGELTFIAGERGLPMTKESFGNWFREIANLAGIAKSAHGLRKARATERALDGYSDAELDAEFGWTGRKMASLYTKAASRERLSLAAAERVKQRTQVPSSDIAAAL